MNKLREAIRLILIILLAIFVCALIFLVLCIIDGERELQSDLHELLTRATGTMTVAQAQINALDVTKLNQTIDEAHKTVQNADVTVSHVRKQFDQVDPRTVNRILLHADKVVGHLDQATHDYVSNQREVTEKTLQVLDSTDTALQNVAPVLTQAQVDLAEANLSLKNVTQTTANFSHTTEQIDHKVTQMLKPMSLTKRILSGISSAGAHVLNWVGAIR